MQSELIASAMVNPAPEGGHRNAGASRSGYSQLG